MKPPKTGRRNCQKSFRRFVYRPAPGAGMNSESRRPRRGGRRREDGSLYEFTTADRPHVATRYSPALILSVCIASRMPGHRVPRLHPTRRHSFFRFAMREGQQDITGDEVRVPFVPAIVGIDPRPIGTLSLGQFLDQFNSPVVIFARLVGDHILL